MNCCFISRAVKYWNVYRQVSESIGFRISLFGEIGRSFARAASKNEIVQFYPHIFRSLPNDRVTKRIG